MSELAPGSVSLDDDPQLAPDPPTPDPAAPPPVVEETDPEGTIEGSGGVKFVPLGAVVETRGKLKDAKAALEAANAELAALKPKAEKFDQVKGEWDAVQPLIQQVRNGTYQPATPQQKPAGPLSDADAIEYAKDLDLYKADGTPDVARAQRLATRQQQISDRSTQQAMQPYQQQTAHQQSASNFEAVATWRDKTGAVVDRGVLQDIWSKMPAELTAQPNVAAVMYRVALAETMLQGKHKAAVVPPPPAQHTEGLGGGQPGRTELTTFERGFIDATNMKPKEYEDISARFKPGERNSLE